MIHTASAGGYAMSANLSGFFNAEVTILHATNVQDTFGEAVSSYAADPELMELPGLVAGGDVSIRMKKQELRTTQAVYEMEYRRVLLNGAYPTIKHTDHALLYGREWSLVSITIDYTSTFTELLCESLEPGAI